MLTQIGATLNAEVGTVNYGAESEKLQHHICDNVNFTNVDDIAVPEAIKAEFSNMILNKVKAFSASNNFQLLII